MCVCVGGGGGEVGGVCGTDLLLQSWGYKDAGDGGGGGGATGGRRGAGGGGEERMISSCREGLFIGVGVGGSEGGGGNHLLLEGCG